MFFQVNENDIQETELTEFDERIIHVGYLTLDELEENRKILGINEAIVYEFRQEQTHFRNGIDIYDEFSLGIINIVNVMNINEARDRIGFIIKENLFILVKLIDLDDSYQEMFLDSIGRFKQNPSLEKVIFGILDRLLFNGSRVLENTERQIMKMEQSVVNGRVNDDLNRRIFNLRNGLSIIKNYYEQLTDIGEGLQENENDLFAEEDLRYFKIFTDKTQRLINNIQTLSENLIHLREALDASLNYNLNRIMKMFTVVTTIFLPLTLIVGWYGMNFTNMPELTWKYGYFGVVALSIVVIILCFLFFKRKKLL